MKYLISGASGMLGQELTLALTGRDTTALTRAELDVTDLAAVRAAVSGHSVVINAAAYTRVDDAETQESAAHAVNAIGAQNLAIATAENGAKLVQVSTDYVFDGSASEPYAESTPINPIGAYGRTKAKGERLAQAANPLGCFIVRTAWTYGAHGPNFATTMLRLAASNATVSVVTDQLGQPTWTRDLAEQILLLLDADATPGVYHGTNSGEASWFDFAREVFAAAGLDPERVLPTTSAQFIRPAARPDFSVLGHDGWASAGIPPMRHWRDALAAAHSAGALAQPV